MNKNKVLAAVDRVITLHITVRDNYIKNEEPFVQQTWKTIRKMLVDIGQDIKREIKRTWKEE